VDFLAGRAGEDGPFALFLSYTNPHDVYHFGREQNPAPKASHPLPDSWHRKDLSTVPKVQRQFMDEDQGRVIVAAEAPAWERYREIYREKVELYDRELGQVLAALEDAGLDGSTLVIVTSDHGDMDTQQGLIYKGPFLYEHMMRVPFVVRLPGSRASRQVDFPTVNVDVVPTLADFAGVVPPPTDGVSLRPFLGGSGPLPERGYVVGQYYSKQNWVNPIRMLRTEQLKYNLYRVHGEELYDLGNDPAEIHNLAEDAAHAAVKARLADCLAAWMQANGDPFSTQSPTTRDGTPLTEE
jgi:choline-sulfatase